MSENQQLLADYVENGSEPAFRELVNRYVDLVYSAAVRLVNGDTHLAEDVSQTVFADLARLARTLSPDVMLGGWLHRHTCFVASNTMRRERRRENRERQAVAMNSTEDHSAANLALIAPVLDEAINQLGTEDRKAILLRYFEQRDFQSVGEALGSNEDAARKRVNRALEKLHTLLTRRGVALSAAALASTLATQVVSAAPAGLALNISSAALLSAAAGGGTSLTLLKIMSMTKLKVAVVSAIVAAGVVAIPWVLQQREQKNLREENASLRQQARQFEQLSAENERLSKQLAEANTQKTTASTNDSSRELIKLRGEVGRLKTAVATPKPSTLSGITSDPQMFKAIRDQQKLGMSMIYKDFTNQVKLPKEQTEKFIDLLADNVMENVDRITAVLRDGKTPEEMADVFAAQDAALLEKVEGLLGADGLSQYKDYTKNLCSHLTAEQFKPQLSGDKTAKEQKSKQLFQAMQEETSAALASAGLPADFQTVPILNFRNIAVQEEGEKNLKLLDGIYERVAERAGSFLTAEELKKFQEFRTNAINGNRMALTMNRKMMAPVK